VKFLTEVVTFYRTFSDLCSRPIVNALLNFNMAKMFKVPLSEQKLTYIARYKFNPPGIQVSNTFRAQCNDLINDLHILNSFASTTMWRLFPTRLRYWRYETDGVEGTLFSVSAVHVSFLCCWLRWVLRVRLCLIHELNSQSKTVRK
jgi:hypothetical protein